MSHVTTRYLWLEGCDPEFLASTVRLEEVVLAAVAAGGFELLHCHCSHHDGRTIALAVVGESHLMLHGEVEMGCLSAEVVSCESDGAALAAVEAICERVAHSEARQQSIEYDLDDE